MIPCLVAFILQTAEQKLAHNGESAVADLEVFLNVVRSALKKVWGATLISDHYHYSTSTGHLPCGLELRRKRSD